jgi:hypothetical protein
MYRMDDAEFARAMQNPKVAQDKMFQEARIRRDNRIAQKQAEREELQKLQNEENKETYRQEMKKKWIANGGDEKSYNDNWPSIWATELIRRVDADESQESTRAAIRKQRDYSL